MTRRRFMGLAVHGRRRRRGDGTFTLPALGFAAGTALFERPPVAWERVGAPGDFPDDTYVPKVITTVQGIGEVGKTTAQVRGSTTRRSTAKRTRRSPAAATSSRSPRAACTSASPARFVEASERFICPCHGGVYDFTGSVSGGPPVRPLDRFYTRVEGGQVEIGPRYSVNSEFNRYPSYRDPAQDLDGIGPYVYPGRFSTPKLD